MLRNLSDVALQHLVDFFNEQVWRPDGRLPREWKEADIVLIPKPGKPRELNHLRPISLTSCMGKLFERVILTRLEAHIERNSLFPESMFGFRRRICAQDVFLLLRDEVLDPPPGSMDRILLALDVHKAFDNISHTAILDGLRDVGCGERVFHYVQDFLSSRSAKIGLGSARSVLYRLPDKGTPQGSILSPLLFNVGLRRMALDLQKNRDLGCAIYADDITLWACKGSYGNRQDTLQQAINTIESYMRRAGMRCAPAKSEYIHIRPRHTQATRLRICSSP